MNQATKLNRISQLLSRFREQVKILNSNGEFGINIHAENILINILDLIFECKFENVNYIEGKNYPSIDLRDKPNRIAIQVTSTSEIKKIKHTIDTFIKNDLGNEYDRLYVLIITNKKGKYNLKSINKIIGGKIKFDNSSIWDLSDIYRELNKQSNLDKINSVCFLLEKQFADQSELNKWVMYCKGLDEYDLFIRNYYQFLDIKGFSPKINNTLIKINLENIYIPLQLKETNIIGPNNYHTTPNSQNSLLLNEALYKYNKIVVLGDPGSGKSTLLKYLAYKICSDRHTDNPLKEFVPIIIKGSEFAKYVNDRSKGLGEYIVSHSERKYDLLLTQKLENEHLLVLIDGIDEINVTELRHDVVNRINAFVAQYPNIKIIVTSRIVGYTETKLSGFFTHLEVLKFKENQIKQFVDNWYLSISENSDHDSQKAKESAKELFYSIKQNSSVLNMASNPLLVTIIALLHYHAGGVLPEKRVALYDIATSTFLENWVRQRGTNRGSSFDKETLIAILAPISYHIHQSFNNGLITEGELRNLFQKEYRKIFQYQKSKEESEDIREIINFLREDAGFLFEKGIDENGESLFGFVHQTFREYFAAIEFKTLWKEGFFKKNFNEYVINSTWNEVIKLCASLFKHNEQSRLGRHYSTSFVNDILNVKDNLPELHRPLKLVLQILIDETEIDFDKFKEILDFILSEILIHKEDFSNEIRNRETTIFISFLQQLIESKYYQNYILNRILHDLKSDKVIINTKRNLVKILMANSDIPIVYEELLRLLLSDNQSLKIILFEYNVVFPVAEIVSSKEFRDEIVKYINSTSFREKYSGNLPAQYHCAFETSNNHKNKFLGDWELPEFSKMTKENLFLSIRLIEDETIRLDYINYNVFSIGIDDVDELQEYVSSLRKEFPGIELVKIEEYINDIKNFNKYGLSEYEIMSYNSVDIFFRKDDNSTLAFVKDKKVEFIKYPFVYNDVKPYFLNKTKEFVGFFNLLMPAINNSHRQLSLNNIDDILLFGKYQNTIHWNFRLIMNDTLVFVLNNLFVFSPQKLKRILKWIKKQYEIKYGFFKVPDDFNKSKFISEVKISALEIHEKLYLIKLVGEKSDYEELIQPTIDKFHKVRSIIKKNEIRDVLYNAV